MKKLAFLLLFFPGSLLASSQLTVNGSVVTINGAKVTIQGTSRGPATATSNIALVQSSCAAHTTASPIFLKFNGSVTAGDTIVAVIADGGQSLATGDVVDNKGNSKYTMRPEGGAGDASARVGVYASTNIATGGTNFVATATISGASFSFCIAEFSGVTLFDQSNTATASSVNVNSGNVTTAQQDLYIGAMTHSTGGTISLTEINAETLIGENENNSLDQAYSFVYKVQGAATDAMKWTAGSSVAWKANVATFK